MAQILVDQFSDGDAAGAWSKRYESYMHFVYGEDEKIPTDMAIRDSISYSGLIAEALIAYRRTHPNQAVSKLIFSRLQLLESYLHRHFNPKQNGFGLARLNARNERNIVVDLRHTIWAVLTLNLLGRLDSKTNEALRKAGAYLNNEITLLGSGEQRAITFAVFHKMLSTPGASNVLLIPETSRVGLLRRIEEFLIEKFDESFGSWDLDKDPPESSGVDNALFVLSTVKLNTCKDERCVNMFRIAVERLCKISVVDVDEDKAALPFVDGGKPDIGATINLLWILWRDRTILGENKILIKRLLNFVLDPVNRENPGQFAYPWHLASCLLLVCDPNTT
jgi:hypothetical protein